MLMAEGQLIKCCSHFFYVCWNFGLSSRWLFLQITLFNTFEPQEPLLLVYLWNFWSAAHSQSTGADIYFCGLCAYPRAGPASPYTIPCPMANVTSLGLPCPFPSLELCPCCSLCLKCPVLHLSSESLLPVLPNLAQEPLLPGSHP